MPLKTLGPIGPRAVGERVNIEVVILMLHRRILNNLLNSRFSAVQSFFVTIVICHTVFCFL